MLEVEADVKIGAEDEKNEVERTKNPQPLLRDFAAAATISQSPQVIILNEMYPATGRVWEVTQAGVFGQDGHTPLTISTPGTNVAPVVPGSTVAVQNTNSQPVTVVITGGTMTAVIINGITVGTGAGTYLLPSGGAISLTYTVAPTWTWTTPATTTPVIADIYAGPSTGTDFPGDFSSFVDSGSIPCNFLIGDHKCYANAGDRIYAWIYGITTATQVILAGTVRDWRVEDRSEVTV